MCFVVRAPVRYEALIIGRSRYVGFGQHILIRSEEFARFLVPLSQDYYFTPVHDCINEQRGISRWLLDTVPLLRSLVQLITAQVPRNASIGVWSTRYDHKISIMPNSSSDRDTPSTAFSSPSGACACSSPLFKKPTSSCRH